MTAAYCARSLACRPSSSLPSAAASCFAGAAASRLAGAIACVTGLAAGSPGWPCALFQNRSVFSTRPSLPPSLCQFDSVSLHLASTRSPKSLPQVAGHLARSVVCAS